MFGRITGESKSVLCIWPVKGCTPAFVTQRHCCRQMSQFPLTFSNQIHQRGKAEWSCCCETLLWQSAGVKWYMKYCRIVAKSRQSSLRLNLQAQGSDLWGSKETEFTFETPFTNIFLPLCKSTEVLCLEIKGDQVVKSLNVHRELQKQIVNDLTVLGCPCSQPAEQWHRAEWETNLLSRGACLWLNVYKCLGVMTAASSF